MIFMAAVAFGSETWEGRSFFVGDPHAHTGVSRDGGSSDFEDCDGTCGAFEEVFTLARIAGLDWVVLSDHTNGDSGASSSEWELLHESVLDAHDPAGGLVTIPGAEVWFTLGDGNHLGHKTLMMFGDEAQLADMPLTAVQPMGDYRGEVTGCEDIGRWMDELTATWGPALIIPHHPALIHPMATDWSCHFPEYEPGVEVYSQHGLSIDRYPTWDVSWSDVESEGSAEAAIDPDTFGLQLGFLAGTDSHDTQPGSVCTIDGNRTSMPFAGGLTVAVLPERKTLDRADVYHAIRNRQTYATTGPFIPMLVDFQSGGAFLGEMGDLVAVPEGQPLEARVRFPPELAFAVAEVKLVGPNLSQALTGHGDGEWVAVIGADSVPSYFYAEVLIDGSRYWAHTSCVDGGEDFDEWMWGSPSYFVEGPTDVDGDGWAWADGDCDDGDPTVHPGAEETWYDDIDQDCSGGSDFDQDGDGVELGAGDCDDQDPTRAADCSAGVGGGRSPSVHGPSTRVHDLGRPVGGEGSETTGCAHAPADAAGGLLGILMALGLARRQSARSTR